MLAEFFFPDEPLTLIKALLDVLTAVGFLVLLIVIVLAKYRYPVFGKRGFFFPLLGFSIMGFISTAMDAFDEFFWFREEIYGQFYDQIWKPTRLFLFIIAIFLLLLTFYQFYRFSDRIFGEETARGKIE